jgi:predicted nucleic acid-binding protein
LGVRGGLRTFLRRHKVVGADSMIFIYHLEDHPRYAPFTQMIFDQWETGKVGGVTSVITITEVLVKPLRDGNRQVAQEYRRLLSSFPHLSLVDIDRQVARRAADLRANHGIRTPDALQIATALSRGATGFVTNDETVKRVRDIEVLVLEEITRPR